MSNLNPEINSKYEILIVDDEPLIRESLYEILNIRGFRARMASAGEEALQIIENQKIDIVLTDMKLPKMDGIALLEKIKQKFSETEVILITGYGTIESAVDAMKKGAYDYITKPINDSEIILIIQKIIERKEIMAENEDLREIIAETLPVSFCGMIGSSDKMRRVYHMIESVADSNATILISGESGTGKGVIARAIHQCDAKRRSKPFVEVSCGALSETLLESELFGHVKGAFTGAIKDKEGRFEYARGGTIFLDEIDAFSSILQVKLLRVLQDGVFERVGDNETKKTDARVIVATNQELTELVEQGDFREDLYYRINVISIQLPPLRERKEDIELLINHFTEHYAKKNGKKISGMDDDVRDLFLSYDWPGNVRELENAIEGAVIMTRGNAIKTESVPNLAKFSAVESKPADGKSLKRVMEQPEKEIIINTLKECSWNRNKAAGALGINRTTLYNKMKKYNISFNKPKR